MMSHPYEINGVDCREFFQDAGYSTSVQPRYGESVVTLNLREHVVAAGVRKTQTAMTMPLKPKDAARLWAAIRKAIPCRVTFWVQQYNEMNICEMKLSEYPAELAMARTDRAWIAPGQIVFEEL